MLNSHSRDVVRELSAGDVLFMQAVNTPEGRCAAVRSVDYADVWRDTEPRVSLEHFKRWVGDLPRGQGQLGLDG